MSTVIRLAVRHRVAVAFAVIVALLTVATLDAEARPPSWQDRADAKKFARWYWEDYKGLTIPCYGVALRFERMPYSTLAYTTGRCIVHLNSKHGWSWYKLCATVIHEYGHILGYGHVSNPNSIMYWQTTGKRHWACDYE